MRVLVACEFSGTVRDAFVAQGHDAFSCDIQPSKQKERHYQCNVLDILDKQWDMLIAHPPCTYLTNTGSRWFGDPRYPNRYEDRKDAVDFFMNFVDSGIEKIYIENPIGHMSTCYRKPDQIIQPYQFGHSASKATCLWLKNLPKLKPTKTVDVEYMTTKTGKRFSKWYWETSKLKGEARTNARSVTFQGIANAMAEQWGNEICVDNTVEKFFD